MLAFLSPIPAMGYLLLSKDFPPGDTPYSHLKPNFNTKCYSLHTEDTQVMLEPAGKRA
jgi:hypothetical protein